MAEKKTIEQQAAEKLEELKKSKAEREKMTIEARKKRAQRFVSNTLFLILGLMVLGVVFTTLGLYYFSIFVIMGLLPSLVAYISDMRPKKLGSKTVFAMNFTGMIPHIVAIIASGTLDEAAKNTMEDPFTWLVVYGFAMLGWAMIYIIPNIIHIFMDIKADFSIKRLRKEQDKLEDEWGEPVRKLVIQAEKRKQKSMAKTG